MRTPNIQHRTLNIERRERSCHYRAFAPVSDRHLSSRPRRWMLNVQCSMFVFHVASDIPER